MSIRGKSGYLVRTKSGKLGKINSNYELINGKIPVYVADKTEMKNGFEFATSFAARATLCAANTLEHIGFID